MSHVCDMTHMSELCHLWKRRQAGIHLLNKPNIIKPYAWVMSRMCDSDSYLMSHVTYEKCAWHSFTCRTSASSLKPYTWVMSRMRDMTYMNESCRLLKRRREWMPGAVSISDMTYMNESCHLLNRRVACIHLQNRFNVIQKEPYERAMSCVCDMTHTNESWQL